MKVLFYNRINKQKDSSLDKWVGFIESDNFSSADIKKVGHNLYRARLNRSDRVIFTLFTYEQEKYLLVLEYLHNHNYSKSQFIHHRTQLDERKIQLDKYVAAKTTNTHQHFLETESIPTVKHFNKQSPNFYFTDKVISFDSEQLEVISQQFPLFIIGSAGTGKTALLLKVLTQHTGRLLYLTHSPQLAEHAAELYQSPFGRRLDSQKIDFYSFQELLDSYQQARTQNAEYQHFSQWYTLHKQAFTHKKSHFAQDKQHKQKLYEEFRGVLTGSSLNAPYLSLKDYQALGIDQSIFVGSQRKPVYDYFLKFLDYLANKGLHDTNIRCHDYSQQNPALQRYDLIVIDEIQDLTSVQVYFALKTLNDSHQCILCGDANQIVHPSFFSWKQVKTLFYNLETQRHHKPEQAADKQYEPEAQALVQVLNNNYRNSHNIVELANRILIIKQLKFGAIDRSSYQLMQSNSTQNGIVQLMKQEKDTLKHLNKKTEHSTNYAVIVLNNDAKEQAKQFFSTPLIFTIHEAKGLEYPNIIVFNLIASASKVYKDIAKGIHSDDIKPDLPYSRKKDKYDKSLESYKFYINTLYVALTRAIDNLYWIESNTKHPLLNLVQITQQQSIDDIAHESSDADSWQRQANLLNKQGMHTQAEAIEEQRLQLKPVPWNIYIGEPLDKIFQQALNENKKDDKLKIFEYALVYDDHYVLNNLINMQYKPAFDIPKGRELLVKKYYMPFLSENHQAAQIALRQYGIDYRNIFNQTPLMCCAWLMNDTLAKYLINQGADKKLIDNKGYTAFLVALRQIFVNPYHKVPAFQSLYRLLRPAKLEIMLYDAVYTLDPNTLEFIMLHAMIATFYDVMPRQMLMGGGAFNVEDIANACFQLPEDIIERVHISLENIIFMFETYSNPDANNNPMLFVNVSPGHYLFNPQLSIKHNQNWSGIYDLLLINKLTLVHQESIGLGEIGEINSDVVYANLLEAKKQEYLQNLFPAQPNSE